MQIQITGHKIELTPALRDYVQGKITKLEEFFSNIQKVEVVLDAKSNADDNKRQVAEIRAWMAGKKMIQSKEAGQDAYAAFDLALDEAKRQVEKHKEKLGHEKRRESKKLKMMSRLKTPGLTQEY
ncbi:MAG: ribosome-associated translation inhibitor RaiA [Candidatus Margulisiibacteriota bacterium]